MYSTVLKLCIVFFVYLIRYYSGTIIELAGVEDQTKIIWLAAAVASGNFVCTLISMFIVEKVGRRKLIMASITGVCVGLCLLALTFFVLKHESAQVSYYAPSNYTKSCASFDSCYTCVADQDCGFCYFQRGKNIFNGTCLSVDKHLTDDISPFCNASQYGAASTAFLKWSESVCPTMYAWLAVLAMVFYLAMFAPGMGPIPWTINAEIYPLWARSIGTSAATATNWTFNLLVSLTFLNLLDIMTRPGAFLFYAAISFVGLIFVYFMLPETKGKKLEEIENLFQAPLYQFR